MCTRRGGAAAMSASGNPTVTAGGAPQGGLSDAEREALQGIPQGARKALYFHQGANDQMINAMSDTEKREYAKYEAVTVNEDLPPVTGVSQRQIDYATSVRQRRINDRIRDIVDQVRSSIRNQALRSGESAHVIMDRAFARAGVQSFSAFIAAGIKQDRILQRIIAETDARSILGS